MISIFSPHRERLSSYNQYNIQILGDKFRSVTCLKNRYGEADVEIGFNFFGRSGVFAELPKADEINDFNRYTNSSYLLKDSLSSDVVEEVKDLVNNNFKFKM